MIPPVVSEDRKSLNRISGKETPCRQTGPASQDSGQLLVVPLRVSATATVSPTNPHDHDGPVIVAFIAPGASASVMPGGLKYFRGNPLC